MNGFVMLGIACCSAAFAKEPRCTPSTEQPAALARAWLKEAKLADSEAINQAQSTTALMGSQQIGKNHLVEVHRVRFAMRGGKPIEAIVVDEVSGPTCQAGKADVYVVSGRLDPCDNLPKGQACPFKALAPPQWMNEREQRAIAEGRPPPARHRGQLVEGK